MTITSPNTYPARPLNGGPWPQAARFPKPGHWFYEPKYNGWRALVHVPTRTMFNRHGKQLSIASEFAAAMRLLCVTLDAEAFKWVDVEALERRHYIGKGCLIVLDVVPEPEYAGARYLDRRSWVKAVLPEVDINPKAANAAWREAVGSTSPPDFPLLSIPPHVFPDAAWVDMQEINRSYGCEFYEGLVAKRADSTYPVQLRSDDQSFTGWIKHRWAF